MKKKESSIGLEWRFMVALHPNLSYPDSPEPGISVYRAPLIS